MIPGTLRALVIRIMAKEKMVFKLLDTYDWLYHYEVVVTRQGSERVIARVPSRRAAEQAARMVPARAELSQQSLEWRRRRGVHPDKAAALCVVLLLLGFALPNLWLLGIVQLLCLAIIGGLLSSGRQWRQGGVDDR